MIKVLVVDDEADIIFSIEKGLAKHNFDVVAYDKPQKALADFKPNVYDLCLIDIKMPKMDGFQLYREIKQKDSNVKICFLTAFEMHYNEFKKVFPTSDVKCLIRKPTTIEDLVSHIKSELNIT